MGVDASLLSKVLRGKKRWPEGWLDRATNWLSSLQEASQPLPLRVGQPESNAAPGSNSPDLNCLTDRVKRLTLVGAVEFRLNSADYTGVDVRLIEDRHMT